MESLLNRAYFEQHCHQCGHSYALTLYNILQEQRLADEWHNLQGRDIDDPDTHRVLAAIPRDALEEIEAAWSRLVEASVAAGLDLRISPPGEEQAPHHH